MATELSDSAVMGTSEQALGPQRERRRLEQEASPFFSQPLRSLLVIAGCDGYFKRLSAGWTALLGFTEEELMAKPYLEFVDPQDHAATLACAVGIGAGQRAFAFENRYRTKNGECVWLSWNAILSDSGLMYAIAQDVTEKKQAAEQLRLSEENMLLLVESLHDHAIYFIDLEGRIMSWNTGVQRMTGYTSEEVVGKSLTIMYPPGGMDQAALDHLLATAAQTGHVQDNGWRSRKDGSCFQVDGYINALRTPDGKLRGFAKIVRDVTEREAAEQEIRDFNEHLEQRVKDRTAELAAVNKELEAFSYSVSHDLRAPLRHLDGFLMLLRKRCYEGLDESSRRYIDAVLAASKRMGTLIDDLLQFSRLGRAAIRKTPVRLNDIMNEVRAELQHEAEGRNVRWSVAALPAVTGDRGMLRQVFQNLLANALKFTRPREAAEIDIAGATDETGNVVISVTDNGVGFDMAYSNKLFQVFQRLHGEDEFEGTGIGLAIVSKIVERHGGRVWAQSTLGKGAAFYVSLPCLTKQIGEEHEPTETHTAG
jgi:PAS domain S-box-containing protein